MQKWDGLERLFRLSFGIAVGAHAIALVAVLEYKRLIQNGLENTGLNSDTVHLSSEEWRSAAGIFERKTFERAKAKLEELGIIRIERQGRMLKVTLWPQVLRDQQNTVKEVPERISHPGSEETGSRMASSSGTNSGLDCEISSGTDLTACSGIDSGNRLRTSIGTSSATGGETTLGASLATNLVGREELDHGTSTGANHAFGERVAQDQSYADSWPDTSPCNPLELNGSERSTLNRSTLNRYSLNSYSLNNNYLKIINESNEQRNNEQRNNDQRNNDQRSNDQRNSDQPNNYQPNSDQRNNDERVKKQQANLQTNLQSIPAKFARLWQSEVGHSLTSYEFEGIKMFLRMGYTEEILIEALRCAVAADNRHMGYVLGILRNWYQQGVRKIEDIPLVRQRWEDQRFLARTGSGVIS